MKMSVTEPYVCRRTWNLLRFSKFCAILWNDTDKVSPLVQVEYGVNGMRLIDFERISIRSGKHCMYLILVFWIKLFLAFLRKICMFLFHHAWIETVTKPIDIVLGGRFISPYVDLFWGSIFEENFTDGRLQSSKQKYTRYPLIHYSHIKLQDTNSFLFGSHTLKMRKVCSWLF